MADAKRTPPAMGGSYIRDAGTGALQPAGAASRGKSQGAPLAAGGATDINAAPRADKSKE
ncbi:MAG: hypothetical protein RLY86_697 [Pseudomonadota bacterium]|jgi:glycerate kinase